VVDIIAVEGGRYMANHVFHKAIGRLINLEDFPKSESLTILKDRACAEDGHLIYLYSTATNTVPPIELCNVDILIEVGGKARVIVEIEESDFVPVHIFGKFFASVFSDRYKTKGSKPKPFTYPALFIQILKSSDPKKKSGKPAQWDHIAASIRSILTSPLHAMEWEYRLFQGSMTDFVVDGREGKRLVSTIKEFLEQNL
jgi:hypothetical protein